MQGYPSSEPQYPYQSGYPQPPYPSGGYPQQPHQAGYPQPYPSAGYPGPGYPQQSYPDPNTTLGTTMSASYIPPGGEDPQAAFDFTENSIRRTFIRKVYSILTVQLLITVGFISLFIFSSKVQKYFANNNIYLIIAFVVVFVLIIVLACCQNVRRKAPGNFICLFIFTVAMSFLVGVCSATYETDAVLIAAAMTAAITLGLTLFAFQTKIDFTGCGGALFACLIVLFIGGIIIAIFPSKVGNTLIAGGGAILMSFYIIFDTQLMIGGEHQYSISPEEYIFAALTLYLDIINLFLYILRLIGGRD